MKRKLKQYEIYKLSIDRLIIRDGQKIKIVPLTLSRREALENYEVVKIQSNQLTNQIFRYFQIHNIKNSCLDLSGILVNVFIPPESKKRGEKAYEILAGRGFTLNGVKFVRLFSGSGQIRRNTITFIREDLYEPIFTALLCGLTLEDFGSDFNAAKFNAYCGLNMSGCHLLPECLSPRVCVVDDYEAIRPSDTVNWVTEKEVSYIALPTEDYILTEDQSEYEIDGNTATRISDGNTFTIHKGVKKSVHPLPYDAIPGSPALNSFDGQGLMSPEWAFQVAMHLGLSYIPSAMIVRSPWVKGLLANVPFKEWFLTQDITEIKDSFGKMRKVEDIDAIISKSQFKMLKIYRKKCEKLGVNAWDYHTEQMVNNGLLWGVAKINSASDDDTKALNYQYIQALQLSDADIDQLCKPTEDFLQTLNSGDLETVYSNLVVNAKGYTPDPADDDDQGEENYKKLFQKVIEANPDFINDKHIRELIFSECETKLTGAKLGKILTRGNFQFCISDPIAQMQWIARNHCGADIEVKGVVPAGCVYSNYWLTAPEETEQIVLMRSPLIDRNEIAKRTLVNQPEFYFQYLLSGIVYSIHDLTALQQGGCDFDGDITFSTNNPLILKGCYEYRQANPLYYTLSTTDLVGKITPKNIIQADIRGLNSKVGTISNKAGSLYAKLEKYSPESQEYQKIYNNIVALGQIVGMEIDRIKTAVSPTLPLEWSTLQAKKYQNRDGEELPGNVDEEQLGIYRHNDMVPDIKPYYFRYNYEYIDKAIKELDRAFNKVTEYTLGQRLPDFLRDPADTDFNRQLLSQYNKAYPVIDTGCIVNRVCHNFEVFAKDLHRLSVSGGSNLLLEYQSGRDISPELLSAVAEIVESYKRFKRFIARNSRSMSDTRRNKEKRASEAKIAASVFYRDELLELTDNDKQLAFDCLCRIADERTVWDILDRDILSIIRKERDGKEL